MMVIIPCIFAHKLSPGPSGPIKSEYKLICAWECRLTLGIKGVRIRLKSAVKNFICFLKLIFLYFKIIFNTLILKINLKK